MAAVEAPLEVGQQTVFALQVERHLGNQDEVDVVDGKRRVCRNEARFASHHLDDANPVERPLRLGVRARHRVDRP